MSLFLPLVLTLYFIRTTNSASSNEWKSRTIYQLLTDRFAKNIDTTNNCDNLSDYCGGTFQGIINHLDYITGMNFDAIWISPVVENTPNGYHGYWAQNIYNINSHFGSESDLNNLKSQMSKRDMYLMIDVVANHMGNVNNGNYNDMTQFTPFNETYYYHDCTPCPQSCNIENWNDQNEVELCRLAGLPDLNQSRSDVHDTECNWVKDYVVNKWEADGLRIDTVCEVYMDFWCDFQSSAGVYAVGEVDNGDPDYDGPYTKCVDGVLNYPFFYTLRNVFGEKQSMTNNIDGRTSQNNEYNDVNLLGTFMDNHDNDRFLCDYPEESIKDGTCDVPDNEKQDCGYVGINETQCEGKGCCWYEIDNNPDNIPWCYYKGGNNNSSYSYEGYKNGLALTLTYPGIPIIYYGTEQAFNGCKDPNNREVLWPSSYNTQTTLYSYIATVVKYRKKMKIWNYDFSKVFGNDSMYCFTRGSQFLVCLTNVGTNGNTQSQSFNPKLDSGTFCNIFDNSDCFDSSNNVNIQLLNGESKIYIPQNDL